MPRYLVLIWGDEAKWAELDTEEWRTENGKGHEAFSAVAGAAVIGSGELEVPAKSTSLRSDPAGQLVVSDGPYTETKEVIGGYYLLDAPDLDEAIRLSALIPEVRASHSGVEIRPLVDHG